jgi:hypothetical protein
MEEIRDNWASDGELLSNGPAFFFIEVGNGTKKKNIIGWLSGHLSIPAIVIVVQS